MQKNLVSMIKNRTPYVGKIKLLFEKHPHYRSSDSLLNKVHFDFGFTKLVSRMFPNKTKELGWEIDKRKINLINKNTGGYIRNYIHNDFVLENSFLGDNGLYIGDIETGWWYYNNNFKVCDDYPKGVAEVWRFGKLEGYYGYTHRGGQTFTIGDKLFDENWIPTFDELDEYWIESYEQSTGIEVKNINDEFLSEIVSYIPFKKRGSVTISNFEECKQSAINMSKYLS